MPRNASTGVYTPPSNSWNPAQPDTVISSADWNALRADMATALDHAPSTTRALHPTTGQVQDSAFIWGGTAGGTANALTLTLTPPITAYVDGLTIRFVCANTNTGPATVAVNGLPAIPVVRQNGNALSQGDLSANNVVTIVYNGGAFHIASITEIQAQINNGAASTTSSNDITLSSNSLAVQQVIMTTQGKSVVLPNATSLSKGHNKFIIENAGKTQFGVRLTKETGLSNGAFADDSAWSLGTGWSISAGQAHKTSGSASDLSQPVPTTVDEEYLVTFTITNISGGGVRPVLTGGGPDVLGTLRTSPGVFSEVLKSAGNTTFALRANASFSGSVDDVSVELVRPKLLTALSPGKKVTLHLVDNSTLSGKWILDGDQEPILQRGLIRPSSVLVKADRVFVRLSPTVSLHFGYNSSGFPLVFAVNRDLPVTSGTPVLLASAAVTILSAWRISDTKAFVVLSGATNNTCIVTVSGLTCSVSPLVTASEFQSASWSGRQLVAQTGANNDTFVAIRLSGGLLAQVVDASGSTPNVGASTTIQDTPTVQSGVGIFRVSDSTVAAFYTDNSGTPGVPFSLAGVVLTISGTSLAIGTIARVLDVTDNAINGAGFVAQMSSTSYAWTFSSPTPVFARAVAIQVSGTTVTFGAPVALIGGESYNTNNLHINNREFPTVAISQTKALTYTAGSSVALFSVNGTTVSLDFVMQTNFAGGTTISTTDWRAICPLGVFLTKTTAPSPRQSFAFIAVEGSQLSYTHVDCIESPPVTALQNTILSVSPNIFLCATSDASYASGTLLTSKRKIEGVLIEDGVLKHTGSWSPPTTWPETDSGLGVLQDKQIFICGATMVAPSGEGRAEYLFAEVVDG